MMDIETQNYMDEIMVNVNMAEKLLGILTNEYFGYSYDYYAETSGKELLAQYENMAALAKAALDYLYLATDAAKEKPNTIRAKVITKEPERREPQTVKVVIQEPKEPKHQEPEQWDKTAKFTVKGSNANDKE